ncbi:hypothetical protein [Aureispira sp. CCB-E]|uniref:hypothetical protein n=1 Tax=Aureispira sp. CCB-E TaxID=3051121 RepID=UPI0028690732|nr:hypothetical protein [Aureispira sp. CCB-E]WMX15026.1 hypothetical protein QP953_01425 [Aureispira sp. CCB-E]
MKTILGQETLREQPPRYLSPLTCINVLFGGFSIQFGSIFFWFGMIFLLVFGGQSSAIHWFSFDGEWKETEGLLLEINETSTEVNDQIIYEYVFSYNANGQSLLGTSSAVFGGEKEGQIVAVEYKSGNHLRSRIVGMRTEIFPGWVLFLVLIFPAIGFGFLFFGFKENIKALKLLKNGMFTRGKMKSYKATNTSINEETVYAYEFEFYANNKLYIATCKTHLTAQVEDEEAEKILYDKKNPELNIVYDAMGAAPKIDRFGRIKQSNLLALSSLLSTVIGLLINGVIFYFLFMV